MTVTASPAVSDRRILLIVVILMAIGASLVASSSSHFSSARFDDPYYLLKRHLVRILIAGLFMFLTMHLDYRILRRLSPVVYVGAVLLLAGLFVVGHAIRDTNRWYHIEALQMTFQPSEFARLALIMFLAYWLARKGKDVGDFRRGFAPAAVAVLVIVGLMAAQPSYGTAFATAAVAFVMLFLGGARVHHLAALAMSMLGAAVLRVMSVGYVRERILAYIDPTSDIRAANWQPYQSLIALGSGGLFGRGIGESRQKLSWLPDSHTDFIFSILGEEAGLVGTLLVSLLFLLLVLRALKLSRHSGDTYGGMLVVGIGSSIFVYAFLNMAVATAVLPVTGLPLPFMSYGGTALVVNAVAVGMLLNVTSKRTRPRGAR